MIITTGILKFKRISTIKNNNLRPTSNKVRQAIFNVLKHKFEMDAWKKKSCMLDAFAGTGIVALEALSRGFVNTTLVDGSDAIWDMRMIKTDAEIERIKFICSITSDAYNDLPSKLAIGDTEREVVNKLKIDVLNRGADNVPFMPGISGVGGVSQIVCGPSDRVLNNGDILFIDTGSTFDGYFCDFDRNFAFGSVSSEVERVNEVLWQATEAGIKATMPGSSTIDIFNAMNSILEDGGALGNNVGRLGHGLGLQLTEPPSHRPEEKTIIKENMVLTIEPGMEYAEGKMIVHEENILVHKDGAELITKRAPREIPIIK